MAAVIGALRAELSAAVAQFEKDLGKAADAVGRFSQRFQKIGQNMSSVGRSMSLRVSAPVAAFGGLVLKVAGDFEMAMNQVKAVSGATGDEFEKLREQAKELGATTQFSASDAANAMNFLAMAGFKVNDILAAMPDTLKLAAAAQLDMGSAADIVTNILAGYNKDVSELGHATDVLVKAFTSANTNLQQLGEAMKFAGPVASAAGVQFEEAAAALALMGNVGIQASMAGTSLRGAIARMLTPTKSVQAIIADMNLEAEEAAAMMEAFAGASDNLAETMASAGIAFTDASGRLLPLADIIRQLEPHVENAGLFMQLFGQRAGPAMAALVANGSDALRQLTGELQNSAGTAERIAAVQMEGFNGALRELESAFEGLQIAIADSGLLQFMTDLVLGLTKVIQKVSESSPEMLRWATIVAGLAAAIGPVLIVLGSLVSAIGKIAPALMLAGRAITALVAAAGPIGLMIAAVTAAVAVWQNWDQIGPIVQRMVQAVTEWLQNKLGAVLDWVGRKVDQVTGFFRDMYNKVVGGSYVPDMVTGIEREFSRLDSVMVKPAQDAAKGVEKAFQAVGSKIEGLLDKLVTDGKLSLEDLRKAAWDLAKQLFISPLFQGGGIGGAGGLFGGGAAGGGLFGGLFKGLFGGFAGGFAGGGVIPRGQWGIVGERGPEPVFAAGADLHVLPATAAAGGVTQVFNIRATDVDSFKRTERQIARAARQRLAPEFAVA